MRECRPPDVAALIRATLLPYGTVENYRLASALASELTGPAGRTVSEEGETFYLETREQLDALSALQRKLKVKHED